MKNSLLNIFRKIGEVKWNDTHPIFTDHFRYMNNCISK